MGKTFRFRPSEEANARVLAKSTPYATMLTSTASLILLKALMAKSVLFTLQVESLAINTLFFPSCADCRFGIKKFSVHGVRQVLCVLSEALCYAENVRSANQYLVAMFQVVLNHSAP